MLTVARRERVGEEEPSLVPPASSREIELVLRCARTRLGSAEHAAIARLVEDGADWERVWMLSGFHRIRALVYANLTEADVVVPEPWSSRFREHSHATARRNLYRIGKLIELIRALERAGVEAIPFKGSVLAHTVYPAPGLREYADLDVLVRRRTLASAADVLTEMGFEPFHDLTGGRSVAYRWLMHAEAYVRPTDGLTVDLHWKLARTNIAAGLRMERFWENTRKFRIGGRDVRTFTPEATLLTLCIHGARQGPPWSALKWVCDVAELFRSEPELDWPAAEALASRIGHRRVLLIGTALARDLLSAPLPEGAVRACRADGAVGPIVARFRERLLSVVQESEPTPSSLRLRLRERRRDRIATMAGLALIPRERDWSVVRLPRALAWLYLPIRLGRLLVSRIATLRRPRGRRRETDDRMRDGGATKPDAPVGT